MFQQRKARTLELLKQSPSICIYFNSLVNIDPLMNYTHLKLETAEQILYIKNIP